MLLRLQYILIFLVLQLLTVLFYNTYICLPPVITNPLLPPSTVQPRISPPQRTFLELDEYIKRIGAPPQVGRGKATRTKLENNVCIIINEIEGITRTGGISASYSALIDILLSDGYNITILLTSVLTELDFNNAQLKMRAKGAYLEGPLTHLSIEGCGWHCNQAFSVFQWLKRRPHYKIVHFHDYLGHGYYSLLAKSEGTHFHDTTFVVGAHGSIAWADYGNGNWFAQGDDIETYFLEKKTVELADIIVSPSFSLLQWMEHEEWKMPAKTFVLQNPLTLPNIEILKIKLAGMRTSMIKEVVFFGRLETRKGVPLFCDAIERLLAQRNFKVTFLGRKDKILDEDAVTWLKTRTEDWNVVPKIIEDATREEALFYLAQNGRLAVVPSLAENSPFTIIECLALQLPFLASSLPGIAQLVHPDDAKEVLFQPQEADLVKLLDRALAIGAYIPRPKSTPEEITETWLRFHNLLSFGNKYFPNIENPPEFSKPPLVSVCITHRNRASMLYQALQSLDNQDYKNFEVVVVDDASDMMDSLMYLKTLEKEFPKKKWQLHRIPERNVYVGAARNFAAKKARGEYILFMDDDNYAKPNEISTFVKVANHTGAQLLSSLVNYFGGLNAPADPTADVIPSYLFVGSAIELGLWRNCFGDANLFVSKKEFLKVGGFSEEYGLAYEDWDFFVRAILHGLHMEVIPTSLFWKRGDFGMSRMTDYATKGLALFQSHQRISHSYGDFSPASFRFLLAAAQRQGMSVKKREPVFTQPPMLRQVNVQFTNGISLVAVSVPPVTTNPKGELVVPLVFVWKRDLVPIESSWTMFVHVRDTYNKIWGQADDLPRHHDRTPIPTNEWLEKEVITDYHPITLDASITSGVYYVFVGWYRMIQKDPPQYKRLPILQAEGGVLMDEHMAGTLVVES